MGIAVKALKYSAVLIGVYLAVSHASEGGTLLRAGQDFYTGAARTLQGR